MHGWAWALKYPALSHLDQAGKMVEYTGKSWIFKTIILIPCVLGRFWLSNDGQLNTQIFGFGRAGKTVMGITRYMVT